MTVQSTVRLLNRLQRNAQGLLVALITLTLNKLQRYPDLLHYRQLISGSKRLQHFKKKVKPPQHLIGFCFSIHTLFLLKGFSLCFVEDESPGLESLHTSFLVSECQNICYGFVLKSWQMGEGKVWSCRGTASLYSPSCTVILYEVQIKASQKLRARKNEECRKRIWKKILDGRAMVRKGEWIKRIRGRKESTVYF